MKCAACGYERNTHYYDDEMHQLDPPQEVGGEDFLCIDMRVSADANRVFKEEKHGYLYVCPKCGTVRFE